jgi:heparin binding hemagglutinin HbhA
MTHGGIGFNDDFNYAIAILEAPLLAAVGTADLALTAVNEVVASLQEQDEDTRTDAGDRVEEARDRLTKLQKTLLSELSELSAISARINTDRLRRTTEGEESANPSYNQLVERGEAALERIQQNPRIEEDNQ